VQDVTTAPRSGLRGILDRWRGFAQRVARVQTIILLSIVYWLLILPMSLLMRLFGKNPLVHPRESEDSFWTPRADPPYTVERFKRLF